MKRLVLLVCLIASGCTVGEARSLRLLQQEGVQAPKLGGWTFWSCSDDDFYIREFTGTRNKHAVSGVICCGMFKNCTIRYE